MLYVYLDDRDQKLCPVLAKNKAEAKMLIEARVGLKPGSLRSNEVHRCENLAELEPVLGRIVRVLKRDGNINQED